MREIALKMEKVDEEFQKRDLTIIKLDQRLSQAKSVSQGLSLALKKAEKSLVEKNQTVADLTKLVEHQRQRFVLFANVFSGASEAKFYVLWTSIVFLKNYFFSLENAELHEFLQVENQTLNETLQDAEVEIHRLKTMLEVKDGELCKSEEQCRHLVRLSEQRHQQILFLNSRITNLEKRAKEVIYEQVTILKFFTVINF